MPEMVVRLAAVICCGDGRDGDVGAGDDPDDGAARGPQERRTEEDQAVRRLVGGSTRKATPPAWRVRWTPSKVQPSAPTVRDTRSTPGVAAGRGPRGGGRARRPRRRALTTWCTARIDSEVRIRVAGAGACAPGRGRRRCGWAGRRCRRRSASGSAVVTSGVTRLADAAVGGGDGVPTGVNESVPVGRASRVTVRPAGVRGPLTTRAPVTWSLPPGRTAAWAVRIESDVAAGAASADAETSVRRRRRPRPSPARQRRPPYVAGR